MIQDDSNKAKLTESPCVRNCCLDENDICLGCFRYIDEIVTWRNFTNEEREQIVVLCQQRRDNKAID
jgi:predicted Fe-S protein YdhL (DUF1289 family)